jgi:hypothetical protein
MLCTPEVCDSVLAAGRIHATCNEHRLASNNLPASTWTVMLGNMWDAAPVLLRELWLEQLFNWTSIFPLRMYAVT